MCVFVVWDTKPKELVQAKIKTLRAKQVSLPSPQVPESGGGHRRRRGCGTPRVDTCTGQGLRQDEGGGGVPRGADQGTREATHYLLLSFYNPVSLRKTSKLKRRTKHELSSPRSRSSASSSEIFTLCRELLQCDFIHRPICLIFLSHHVMLADVRPFWTFRSSRNTRWMDGWEKEENRRKSLTICNTCYYTLMWILLFLGE